MALKAPVRHSVPEEHRRQIAEVANGVLDGRTNSVGSVTLTANQTTTTVTDMRVGIDSVITVMPKTSNAAAAIGAGAFYVSSRGDGTFVITHADNAQTDREFEYVISGTGSST